MGNNTAKSHYPKSIPIGNAAKRPRWDGPGLPAPPGKPILIPGTDETQPDVVAIRWERSPSNGGSAIVGYLVEHRRLGSPHWVKSTAALCAFPELTLSGLEPGWRYQFRVRAQNALGLSEPSEISDPLTVTLQRAVASAPQFDLELKDTVALENEQAEFVVRFSGSPFPKISWFKDGFEIFSSRRTKILTENGKSVLLIHQTAVNDEGEIKCTATNRAGHASTKARLILEAPPRIRLPRQYEDGLLFEQDETIRLKVSLAGRPPPTVTWYHDGELISKDDRHVFETMDGESVLKIPDAKRSDRGEYTVKATNKLGEDVSSFLVTVTDRPAAPGKAMVTMTLGRSVTLSWKEPEDDGGCKIGTYIVEYYRVGWDVWLKATTSRQTTAALTELIEGSEYKFRVKAENPYGVSDPSEESDVIFIPDLKRGIVTPSLSNKSQSHREISRSRGEKREVSFAVPPQRTRSLTREESKTRNEDDDRRLGSVERSASAQRLTISGRPSRSDSRVTFGPDTMIHVEKLEAPVPPARSKDHSLKQESRLGNQTNRPQTIETHEDVIQKPERPASPRTVTTITVSTPASEEMNRRSAFRDSRARSLSISREKSPSPSSKDQTQEHGKFSDPSRQLRSSSTLILKKQNAIVNESTVSLPAKTTIDDIAPREGDENALHGSSEFMLVLYPEDHKSKDDKNETVKDITGRRQSATEEMEDDEDLLPPPMSLSLPELFSAEHQVVETLREAVSSTELLHERAMERFYKAVAAEEASEVAKRKSQLERKTGELATSRPEAEDRSPDRSSLLRRLSNSGVTTQSLISSWQAKKNRRRSSEGQAEISSKIPLKQLAPNVLLDVEARSDPNLPRKLETLTESWRRSTEEETAIERLRRWHDANVPLLEGQQEKSIQDAANERETPQEKAEEHQQVVEQSGMEIDEEEEEESIQTSEESSEISSADSEDLKMLKTRILARQIIDEEDTYHPRGRPIPHVEPEEEPTYSVPSPPMTPTNMVPKSILKKPKDEPVPVNNFGRPIPPEKPVRKMPPQPVQPREELEAVIKTPVMTESDTDSIVSAAEAAKNRRIQARRRSATPEEESEAIEARMALVNHYTEIVREHSSHRASEEKKHTEPVSLRRSSISDEQAQQTQSVKREEPVPVKTYNKPETQEVQRTKLKETNEVKPAARNGVNSRGPTPAREVKEKRTSRPTSRNPSPASRSRNVSSERGASSRSSSKTRMRTPSQERVVRPPSRAGSEDRRLVREKSVESTRRSKAPSRGSSRASSRSSSRDRQRATTPVEAKMERLQKALERKKVRPLVRGPGVEYSDESAADKANGELAVEAEKAVRSTVSYVTDLTLLMAAVYVYLFKKETMAIPFIALLLYRRIQHEVR